MTGRVGPTAEERLAALEAQMAHVEEMAGAVSYLNSALVDLRRRTGLLPLPGERLADGGAAPPPEPPSAVENGSEDGDDLPPRRPREPDRGVVCLGSRAIDHRVPRLDTRTPTAWRGRSPHWLQRAWIDLDVWLQWLLCAYRLDDANDGWSAWWLSRGTVEELLALREWHRELVDVEVVDADPDPGTPFDVLSELERASRQARLDRGRDWVSWHDALERVTRRLTGSEARTLMTRERDMAPSAAVNRAEQLAAERKQAFAAFLSELDTAAVGSSPPPATSTVIREV